MLRTLGGALARHDQRTCLTRHLLGRKRRYVIPTESAAASTRAFLTRYLFTARADLFDLGGGFDHDGDAFGDSREIRDYRHLEMFFPLSLLTMFFRFRSR